MELKPSTLFCGLHGFLGSPKDFLLLKESLIKRSPQHIQFCFPDLLLDTNFKKARDLSMESWTKIFYQQFLKKVLKKEAFFSQKILCGYSMGGRMALHIYFHSPHLWDKVILISTNPGMLSQKEKEERRKKENEWISIIKTQPWETFIKKWNEQEVFCGDEPHVLRDKEREKGYQETCEIFLKHWSVANHSFSEESLRKEAHKIHWVMGERDSVYQKKLECLIQKKIALSYEVVPKGGHRLLKEASRFSFLSKLSASRQGVF